MSLEPAHRRSSSGGGSIGSVCAALARLSLDLSGGRGGAVRPGTLMDEYKRLAIEAQLSRAGAVLRRSYSEPSPSRIVVLSLPAAARRGENAEEGEGRSPCEAQRFWLLEALKRVWCWLGAWGWHGRKAGQPMPPPAAAPRVCLLDYLR